MKYMVVYTENRRTATGAGENAGALARAGFTRICFGAVEGSGRGVPMGEPVGGRARHESYRRNRRRTLAARALKANRRK